MNDNQPRGEPVQFTLSEYELAALDVWRFTRRLPTRAAAMRELLRQGLGRAGYDLGEEAAFIAMPVTPEPVLREPN